MIPRVYGAIHEVAAALSKEGIAKERLNTRDDYLYRSIDDVLRRLSPLLAEHKLCILPRVIDRAATDRIGENDELLVNVTIRCAFDIISVEDGSSHVIEAFGEALDPSDKATAKAMQSAYKYAVLQAFCVPVRATADADAHSHRLISGHATAEPREGWSKWSSAFEERLARCETPEEVAALQNERRPLLTSLSRERPELYKRIGEAIADRRGLLGIAALPLKAAESNGVKRRASKRPLSARKVNGSSAHV